jgi:membrane-bound lytic murein transglycosylase A
MRAFILALLVLMSQPDETRANATYTQLTWADLAGWADDDHGAALSAFLETCTDLPDREWETLCALAQSAPDPRGFFELLFHPVLIEDGTPGLFTGYFEPELDGARTRSAEFPVPLYRRPPDLVDGRIWHSRAAIEEQGLLAGKGLEIVWVDDPVEAFFLQVQGSGRVRLATGEMVRVGYDAKNGHEYRSIGQELVRRGTFEAHEVSATVIRDWVRKNPTDGAKLLRHNPSFVFFREVSDVPASEGPLGAMNRSITTMRSIAVDPEFVPLGAPVWIEKGGDDPLNRLMVAQDTGSAIKGAQRADVFYGTGEEAGIEAGNIKDPGRMVVLLPIKHALALFEDD